MWDQSDHVIAVLDLVTYFHCCGHNLISNIEIFIWEFIVFQVKWNYAGENSNHGVITESINAEDVKVSQETGRDRIPSSTREAHSCDELEVNEVDCGGVDEVIPERADGKLMIKRLRFSVFVWSPSGIFQRCIIPVSMIHILSEELHRRLRPKRLQCRHVQIIYKDDTLLSHGRPKHPFPSLV